MINLVISIILFLQIVPVNEKVHFGDTYPLPYARPQFFGQDNNYFAGNIMIHIIFPESNGIVDKNEEDWQPGEIELLTQRTRDVMDWYSEIFPIANITYTIKTELVHIDYEMARHDQFSHGQWLADIMDVPTGDEFDKIFEIVYNDKQSGYGSSFYIIFVRNTNTRDYIGNSTGYAYIGGPLTVVNTYPLETVRSTVAHEIGHIYGALDQYKEARSRCNDRSGVYWTENLNTDYADCGVEKTSSIMKNSMYSYANRKIDKYAAQQMGIKDDNCNWVIDHIDTDETYHCKFTYLPLLEGLTK